MTFVAGRNHMEPLAFCRPTGTATVTIGQTTISIFHRQISRANREAINHIIKYNQFSDCLETQTSLSEVATSL